MRVVHSDRLILSHYFSDSYFKPINYRLLCTEAVPSPHTQDMHKKLQDEKNGPQKNSGFVWSAVIKTYL